MSEKKLSERLRAHEGGVCLADGGHPAAYDQAPTIIDKVRSLETENEHLGAEAWRRAGNERALRADRDAAVAELKIAREQLSTLHTEIDTLSRELRSRADTVKELERGNGAAHEAAREAIRERDEAIKERDFARRGWDRTVTNLMKADGERDEARAELDMLKLKDYATDAEIFREQRDAALAKLEKVREQMSWTLNSPACGEFGEGLNEQCRRTLAILDRPALTPKESQVDYEALCGDRRPVPWRRFRELEERVAAIEKSR